MGVVRFVIIAVLLALAACASPSLPPSPSSTTNAAAAQSLESAPTLAPQFLFEPSLSGSNYQLISFDGTTFSFANNQGSFAAPIDAETKFRRPQSLADPYSAECQALLNVYMDPINSDSFFGTLKSYAAAHCNARIIVQFDQLPPSPILPPNPIRILSFQPIS